MKKFLLVFVLFCSYFMQKSHGAESALEFSEQMVSGNLDNPHYFIPILLNLKERAGFFGFRMGQGDERRTNIFNYLILEHCNDGDYCVVDSHLLVACYSDGFVITEISGIRKGFQVVIFNNEIAGISYPDHQDGETKTNTYEWGRVITTPNWQHVIGLGTTES